MRATPGPPGCAVAGKRAPSGDAERGNPGTADSMIYAMIARFACNDQGKVGGGRSAGSIPAGCVVVEPVGEPLGEAIAAEGTLGGEDLPNHSIGRARPANGLPFSSRDLKRIPPIPPQAEQGRASDSVQAAAGPPWPRGSVRRGAAFCSAFASRSLVERGYGRAPERIELVAKREEGPRPGSKLSPREAYLRLVRGEDVSDLDVVPPRLPRMEDQETGLELVLGGAESPREDGDPL